MDETVNPTSDHFPTLFAPLEIGNRTLRSRVIMPPHSSAIGNLYGTDAEAEKAIAYLRARADAGVAWTTIPGRLGNILIPGFEPSGVSAEVKGYFRLPQYLERVGAYVESMHEVGALAAQQMTMIGGFPHGPSDRYTSPISNLATHVLNTDEISRLVEEYAYSASRAAEAGIDVLELHANHDDLQEWFLSPLTNAREDGYGGSFEGRMRFVLETLAGIRSAAPDRVIGMRMNMSQQESGGIDTDLALRIAQEVESSGYIDYLHLVTGSPWGNPSYIQPMWFPGGSGAETSLAFKQALTLPIVHTGRINSPEIAERILTSGAADVVGIARSHIADAEFLPKAREGRSADIRPCIGGNDCINRRYVDGLPFGCAVNPHSARENELPWSDRRMSEELVVVGGGPAGMELAALCAEAGASVTIMEKAAQLGGQLTLAVQAPQQEKLAQYVAWQTRRLDRLGVAIRLGAEATADELAALPSDTVVAVATGATSRRPAVPGTDSTGVLDSWDVMRGAVDPGQNVLIVAEDDHLPPLLLADLLAEQGRRVTLVYSTPTAAVLLGRYIIGSILGKLDASGVRLRYLEKLTWLGDGRATFRHIYSGRETTYDDFDSVVLSCGGTSNDSLYQALRLTRPDTHVLGDAYAPRRLVFATRQAYALAEELTTVD